MRVIKYRESFSKDQDEIFEYVAKSFGLIYADNFLIEVLNIIELLVVFPEIGKSTVKDKRLFKFAFGKNWYLYYYDDKNILFVGLIDTRRKLNKKL